MAVIVLVFCLTGRARFPKSSYLGSVNDERNVVELLEERVERLQQVNRTVDGWKDIVDKHGIDNLSSENDIFIIRHEVFYSLFSLQLCLGGIPLNKVD